MDLKLYIGSVITVSLICSILMRLLGGSRCAAVVRVLCGLLLTVSVIQPVRSLDLAVLTESFVFCDDQGAAAAAAGSEMAQDALRRIIKEEAETYILDKAAALDAQVTVEITVSEDPVPAPVEIQIRGSVSPHVRCRLEEILEQELGIAKEKQLWTG